MDVNMLMASQVPPVFKDLTITPIKIAYPKFQEELSRLQFKGLLERTLRESVHVSCICNLAFACITFIACKVTDSTCLILPF